MRNLKILLALATATVTMSADTLTLQSGRTLTGAYLGGDNHSIRFAVGDQIRTYVLNEVDSIRFDGTRADNPSSRNDTAPNPTAEPPRSYDSYSTRPSSTIVTNVRRVEVPAGTPIVVRLIDPVNSETDRLGQSYRASLDQPIVVDGQTVVPRGADATATLIDAQNSGKISGRTILTIDLKTINVNGRNYDIVTTGVPEASNSRGERSAKVIGGTAALGAIIGGIAGGGKGAAIGAGSGAAVGTAAEVATSGQKVQVPAETRLTFTLQNPINF